MFKIKFNSLVLAKCERYGRAVGKAESSVQLHAIDAVRFALEL